MRWLALGVLGLAACAEGGEAIAPPVVPPPAPPVVAYAAPKLRLPDGARPVKQAAKLTIEPGSQTFQGETDLDVVFARPTDVLWLDATDLQVEEAHLEQAGARVDAKVVSGGQDFLGFAFPKAAAAGAARLHVKYAGKILGGEDHAVFSVVEDGKPYVFSQFENIDARRAFPCFDEPGFKHPWQLDLRVKPGMKAFSNTPALKEEASGGYVTVHFAETKPLPAYLVAFAVGPFEVVDAGKTRAGTPVRITTPAGRAVEAAYAAKSTAKIIDALEAYFGIPYPYAKMDVIPVPRLASFGAMENAGLVTIGMSLSLARKDEQTPTFERDYFDVVAHELAHQWFGDLVTMQWWDDVWLNEAFATWMGSKIIHGAHPEWRMDISRRRDASRAMRDDGLASARKIRQPIETKDDITNAFDTITYEKGATVIGMFEHAAGADAFQAGIRLYLKRHAFKNATADDFLADVSEGAHASVAAPFRTFLDQAGVPLVKAKIACEKGGAKLTLEQERFVPMGSRATPAIWTLPVCLKFDGGKGAPRESCFTLAEKAKTFDLPGACPTWAMPNARGLGYYRAAYDAKALDVLLRKHAKDLTLVERVAVAEDAAAYVQTGRLAPADAYALAPDLAKDADPAIVNAALDLVGVAHVPDEMRPNYARFIAKSFGAAARKLGWKGHAGDSSDTRQLRLRLLQAVATVGEDAPLSAEAKALALAWFADPTSLDFDAVEGVLASAAAHGDRALFERMKAEAKKTTDDNRRERILGAMAHFRDPAILRDVYGLVLSKDFDPRESLFVFFYSDRFSEDTQIAFVRDHWDAILARLPAEIRPAILRVGAGACSKEKRTVVEAAFKAKAAGVQGGPRRYDQVMEGIDVCIAHKAATDASVTAFLKKL